MGSEVHGGRWDCLSGARLSQHLSGHLLLLTPLPKPFPGHLSPVCVSCVWSAHGCKVRVLDCGR